MSLSCNPASILSDACIKDALTDSQRILQPSIPDACSQLSQSQPSYLACICERWGRVANCFQIFCPNDPNASSARDSAKQFCAAAAAASRPSSAPTLTAVPLATSAPIAGFTSRPTASPSEVVGPKTGELIGIIIGAVVAVLLLVFGFLYYRKRSNVKTLTGSTTSENTIGNSAVNPAGMYGNRVNAIQEPVAFIRGEQDQFVPLSVNNREPENFVASEGDVFYPITNNSNFVYKKTS